MKSLLSRSLMVADLAMPVWMMDSAFAESPFDGQWNISVTSEQSAGCDVATSPYVVAVKDGAVTPISGPSRLPAFFASVDASGKIEVVAAEQDRSVASGRLGKDGSGSGTWSSPDSGCSGTWTARRISP